MTINDKQLDAANIEIRELQTSVRNLQAVCVRRLELLREVLRCGVVHYGAKHDHTRIPLILKEAIEIETEENEVGS